MNLQRLMEQMGGMGGPPVNPDAPMVDSAETIYISSLALLKMLKHGRAGVPMEVMGLMLGEFVDEYTIVVRDVFAMPQSGTGVSVEAVDPVFQTAMLDMLKQTGRHESVVGWYHSHPGFGCWLSGVDVNTQQSFEQLNPRAVAVVIDPIQSVRGRVVIDAFRSINPQLVMMGQEPRQTTSVVGLLNKPSIQALIHGLGRHYYSLCVGYLRSGTAQGDERETKMLTKLGRERWSAGLQVEPFDAHESRTGEATRSLVELAKAYAASVAEESTVRTQEDMEALRLKQVGRVDAKRRAEEAAERLMEDNVIQSLTAMLGVRLF